MSSQSMRSVEIVLESGEESGEEAENLDILASGDRKDYEFSSSLL